MFKFRADFHTTQLTSGAPTSAKLGTFCNTCLKAYIKSFVRIFTIMVDADPTQADSATDVLTATLEMMVRIVKIDEDEMFVYSRGSLTSPGLSV